MTPSETGVCAYCGMQATHEIDVPAPTKDRASEKIERFNRLAEHPSFDKWMRWRPTARAKRAVSARSASYVLLAVGLILVVGAFAFERNDHFMPTFVGIVLIVFGLRVLSASPDAPSSIAPTKPYAALVVTKRPEVTTSNQSARTSYFTTLEFRTGTRREYEVDGEFYGLVAEDDIGVAYIAEGSLESFKKIDV